MKKCRGLLPLILALSLIMGMAPALAENTAGSPVLRVHYQNPEDAYEGLGIWFWGDVQTPSEQTGAWPGGRTAFAPENITGEGAFIDIALLEGAAQVGTLVIDEGGAKLTPEDLMIDLPVPGITDVWINNELEVFYEDPRGVPENHLRVRLKSPGDDYDGMAVWFWGDVETPSEASGPWPTGATPLTAQEGPLGAYMDIALKADAREVGFLFVNTGTSEQTQDYLVTLTPDTRVIYMRKGDDSIRTEPFAAAQDPSAGERPVIPWQQIDERYYTDSPLGSELMADGSAVLRLWAPTADSVEAVLYAAHKPDLVLRDQILMQMDEKGVWSVTLNSENTPLANLGGAFYQFRVRRGGEARLVLDPYAKSLAAWDSRDGGVAKAAIINPDAIGPALDFASIPGYRDREDAIIYEAHVRDFTSDPGIEGELGAPYGTFKAFISRLDYLKALGVTHIQLLPVLSFYHVNEMDRERSLEYAAENQNYNWGYDPQSYFALSGMYATDPARPETRVLEFKELVDAIHARGMGVILDVVYNHTAKIELLEDIQPNYYYFMDSKGKPKGSFGGGQVGSTHGMVRRLIADSLAYLTETYKVDGFRFDMMGNLDLETVRLAHEKVAAINPETLWIGEGWRTFNGDAGVTGVIPADQGAMDSTDAVAVFSDEVRNELKSGFGIEGQPRFLTGGKRPVALLFDNVRARPGNVSEDDPGDIVQYIEAHDNLTLHDVIALSIRKDPKDHEAEILRRVRLGNALLLTHQGIIFLHAGQEYGRTKQFRHPDYIGRAETPPAKSTFMQDAEGRPFEYPYFIHDSYDASDAVNMFDWGKALESPPHRATLDYTSGLVAIRKSTDAFSYANQQEVEEQVRLALSPSIEGVDLLLAFTAASRETGDVYLVAVNADSVPRELDLSEYAFDLSRVQVLADAESAGTAPIARPKDVALARAADGSEKLAALTLQPLTAAILKITR